LWSTEQKDGSFHEKTDHMSAGTERGKNQSGKGLAHLIEGDEEYNYGGAEEEFQEIHAEFNVEGVGDNSMTEDRAETPQLTYVVAVLTIRP
jgi:hypothetical protein